MLFPIFVNVVSLIVAPLGLAAWAWRSTPGYRTETNVRLVLIAAVYVLLLLIGGWHWVGYYWRFVLAALLIALAIRNLFVPSHDTSVPISPTPLVLTSYPVAIAGVVGLIVWTAIGYTHGSDVVYLEFPLKNGTFYIGDAGGTSIVNYHMDVERYGLDIHKLNALGMRAHGVHPLDNERYAIFGEPVYSPCDGTVTETLDGMDDRRPASSLDAWLPAGNHVVIQCRGVEVTLAHMKMGTVAVNSGETTATGQRIGSVGNSGYSTAPHLHIHAETAAGRGVPVLFEGKFLVRNMVVLVR